MPSSPPNRGKEGKNRKHSELMRGMVSFYMLF